MKKCDEIDRWGWYDWHDYGFIWILESDDAGAPSSVKECCNGLRPMGSSRSKKVTLRLHEAKRRKHIVTFLWCDDLSYDTLAQRKEIENKSPKIKSTLSFRLIFDICKKLYNMLSSAFWRLIMIISFWYFAFRKYHIQMLLNRVTINDSSMEQLENILSYWLYHWLSPAEKITQPASSAVFLQKFFFLQVFYNLSNLISFQDLSNHFLKKLHFFLIK